jgi:hypothetical protein
MYVKFTLKEINNPNMGKILNEILKIIILIKKKKFLVGKGLLSKYLNNMPF